MVAAGDITIEDIYRFFPMPFAIATAETTGKQVREIAETLLTVVFSPNVFNHFGGWTWGLSGIDMDVNLANPDGSRVLQMRLADTGAVIREDQTLSITGCRRPLEPPDRLCNFRGFNKVRPLIRSGTGEPWSNIALLIEGFENRNSV